MNSNLCKADNIAYKIKYHIYIFGKHLLGTDHAHLWPNSNLSSISCTACFSSLTTFCHFFGSGLGTTELYTLQTWSHVQWERAALCCVACFRCFIVSIYPTLLQQLVDWLLLYQQLIDDLQDRRRFEICIFLLGQNQVYDINCWLLFAFNL